MERRRVVIHKPGSYDRLRLELDACPEPGTGEVLVAVAAAGVQYADCLVRMGVYASAAYHVGWPITPGFEFAGRVLRCGEGVDDLDEGVEVFGVIRFGGYASHVVVPRHQLFRIPASLTMPQAAAFPSVFLTAYHAFHELTRLRPGARVLVHSAAGGVGGALVQLARMAGVYVVGVVGASHKVGVVEALGADVVIDTCRGELWNRVRDAVPEGFDAVFDANGYTTLAQSFDVLAPMGRLVIYGFHTMLPRRGGRVQWWRLVKGWLLTPRFNPLEMTGENRSVMAFNLSYLFNRETLLADSMGRLLGWLEDGTLRPPQVTLYPWVNVMRAHRDLESGQTVGKLVLLV